jgi:hypothetical protein
MEQTQTASEALLRLEEPFASKEVKWIVKATSRDGRQGRVVPYADPRAYTDRLNQVFTASGWTRQYTVHTVSPITRAKKDKAIQTGKVMVTCVVSITGFGSHTGSGEEWADDENDMTSAESQRVASLPQHFFFRGGQFMRVIECSMCCRRAAWLIDREVFGEGHKEVIVQEAGIDRFTVRRLTEADCAFRAGGGFSRSTSRKKGPDKSDGQSHSNSL